jgi:hypothetical protein
MLLAMDQDLPKTLREVDAFFMGRSSVHRTLQRLARAFQEVQVEFALAGGLAVGERGHLRATVDVDVVITADGLRRFKECWLGRGYVETSAGSKSVRDTETQVRIDFLIAGEFPGDGRPKPVRFPAPDSVPKGPGEVRVLDLRTLLELKLASGISAADRIQDLADVVALIRANHLSEDFETRLDASVREKYAELWRAAQQAREP